VCWRASRLTTDRGLRPPGPALDARAPGAIRADGAGFTFAGRPSPAFSDVSFEVRPGECLLVVGPSGSGKSTLALAIAGLVPREFTGEWRGRLLVDGLDPASASAAELAARVGLVFQDPDSQLVMERVEDDVAFGLESRGWPLEAMRRRVPQVLGEVGLSGLERRLTARLSGGQQQRLALAGALAPRPGILVLDEPTANLDPPAARAFAARLAALRASRAVTIVLVEHRVDIAWALADVVLALGPDGRPIDVGPPPAVLERSRQRLLAAGAWLPDDEAPSAVTGGAAGAPGAVATLGSGPAVVTAHGLSFAYDGPPVVRSVDLALSAGERVALIGTNGSGKSTLARLLVGLLRPADGRVRLGDADPSRLAPAELARRAAFVFQDPEQQFVTLRVEDEVMLGLGETARREASALMDRMDMPLAQFGDRSPYSLSGGEQRRLSLATALVRHPRLIVLDEPTYGQDRRGHQALVDILAERVDAGAAVLAATHDERFVEAFASRIVRLEAGRIVAVEMAGEGAA
jgi:energy-coupling factor transport system ATP-binding protein